MAYCNSHVFHLEVVLLLLLLLLLLLIVVSIYFNFYFKETKIIKYIQLLVFLKTKFSLSKYKLLLTRSKKVVNITDKLVFLECCIFNT